MQSVTNWTRMAIWYRVSAHCYLLFRKYSTIWPGHGTTPYRSTFNMNQTILNFYEIGAIWFLSRPLFLFVTMEPDLLSPESLTRSSHMSSVHVKLSSFRGIYRFPGSRASASLPPHRMPLVPDATVNWPCSSLFDGINLYAPSAATMLLRASMQANRHNNVHVTK